MIGVGIRHVGWPQLSMPWAGALVAALSYAVAAGVVVVDDCVMVGRGSLVDSSSSSCGGISVDERAGREKRKPAAA